VFDGGRNGDASELSEMAATLHWWREITQERHGRTQLMVETHDSLYTAEAIERFLEIAPGTAILWDSHHTWKLGREDPLVTWNQLSGQIVHIHVKDSVSRPSGRHPYTYVPPGEGEFPASALLAALERDFSGTLSFEWERYWHPELPSLESALHVGVRNLWWP
jgi:sugar phosphate isomerase/epimerase